MKSERKELNICLLHFETTQWVEFSLLYTEDTDRLFHIDTEHTRTLSEPNRRQRSRTFVCCTSKQHSESNFLFFTQKTQIDFFTQTLTQLSLGLNEVGEKGAEHLSTALRNNTVSRIFSSLHRRHRSTFSYRHWTHSNSLRTKSETKEQNICLLHFEPTQWVEFSLLHTEDTDRLFHTDTHRIKSPQQSNRRQRSRTFVCCTSKQQSELNFLFFHTKHTDRLFHIDTEHTRTLSEPNRRQRSRTFVCCTSKQHSESNFLFFTQKTQIDFFTQTLTELNLHNNQIGDRGAEHLSAALRNNKVSWIFSSSTQNTQIDFFI